MSEKQIVKEYTNGEITVVWKPDVCIHSTKCWKGLLNVFDPRKKPWVNMEGAPTERIIKQVAQCPSGALSYYSNNEPEQQPTPDTVIEVTKNGPLLVKGTVTIKDKHGNESIKDKVTALCRCGQSGNKPYCDGTHRTCGFKDE